MNEFNFSELKNFEVPESWVENALNIPSKNKKAASPVLFYRFAAGIAACVVLGAAVILSLVFGIGDSVKLTDPAPNDRSQISAVTDSTDPDETGHIDPSGQTSVLIGRDEQSATAVTEPSENGTSSDSKSNRKSTSPENKKSKTQPTDGTKPNSGNSKQKPVSSDTQPGTGEIATQTPATQEPTEYLPEPYEEPTIEPWEEPITIEPTTSAAAKRNLHFTMYAKIPSSSTTVYFMLEDKNGIVITNAPAKINFYSSGYSLIYYSGDYQVENGDSVTVTFYNPTGKVYVKNTVKIGPSDYINFGFH